jgi:hypothetical protein
LGGPTIENSVFEDCAEKLADKGIEHNGKPYSAELFQICVASGARPYAAASTRSARLSANIFKPARGGHRKKSNPPLHRDGPDRTFATSALLLTISYATQIKS